jgi:hypothetical protein
VLEKVAKKEGFRLRVVARANSFSKVVQLARTAELAAFVPAALAGHFPVGEFSRYRKVEFSVLSRSVVLAVAKSAVQIRPALERAFTMIARMLEVPG